jgi:hypothetical protein
VDYAAQRQQRRDKGAGQSFEIERQGLTLVIGFEGAVLSIVKPGEHAFLPLRSAPYVV